MKINNSKVIRFNLKVLKFIRVYGVKNRKFGWLLAVSCLVNNILQLGDIIHNFEDTSIDGLVIRGFLWACIININHKFTVFLFKNKRVDIVMEFVDTIWNNSETIGSPIEKDILKNSLSRGSKIILFNLSSIFFGIILSACYPLLIGARETPYEWYIPGVDTHASPLYEILYIYQSLYLITGLTLINITYANLVLTWLIFGLIAFRLLAEKIRLITYQETEERKMEALYDCIRFHNKIIEYINVVKGIISPVSFVEIALLSLMLCFLMFYALYVSFDKAFVSQDSRLQNYSFRSTRTS